MAKIDVKLTDILDLIQKSDQELRQVVYRKADTSYKKLE